MHVIGKFLPRREKLAAISGCAVTHKKHNLKSTGFADESVYKTFPQERKYLWTSKVWHHDDATCKICLQKRQYFLQR